MCQPSCYYIAAVLELGALIGALEAGILADKFSRRQSIMLASRESLTQFYTKIGTSKLAFKYSGILYWITFANNSSRSRYSHDRKSGRWCRDWCSQVGVLFLVPMG
jgi:MFS-type transporter involved in bile tolerance (Atg22 family)